jgi:DNA-binding transcriptional ArsR family regulator
MSYSSTVPAKTAGVDGASDRVQVVDADQEIQALLDALEDPACRAILAETGDASLSASELSAACDLPLSTTYRKLDALTDAALLEERTRIQRSGKHASEYSRRVEDVVVSVGDEVALLVSDREDPDAPAGVGLATR